ncbi:hypothetical protein BD410DRAFT_840625 [Rickenella mellea]|uniref:Uncharacterized protein n=1 Tax=Rickenella mellea TaxID=50990 RepID=A0A4Y7Q1C1_9AGAM|nr:hypothetical protein BD410DRAFT_840625 [Rickenella mellea]
MTTIGGVDLVGVTIAASGTLLAYDYIFVTFDQEAGLTCMEPNVDIGQRLIGIGIIISEFILMMRTYALWGLKRSVFVGLTILAIVIYIPAIIITQIEVESFAYVGSSSGCQRTKPASKIIFLAFVLLAISETVLVLMTVVKVWNLKLRSNSRFLSTMYRDGLIYYLYLFGMTLINLIIPLTAPADFSHWLITPQRVLHSVLCTRVLLHIRAGNVDLDAVDPAIMTTLLDMSFDAAARTAGVATEFDCLGDVENLPNDFKESRPESSEEEGSFSTTTTTAGPLDGVMGGNGV